MSKDFPLVSKSGKSYRLETDERGRQVRIYQSGVIWDEQDKRLISGSPDNRISTANAAAFSNARWEKAREQFEAGAIEAVDGRSPADAQRALAKALMKRAVNPFSAAGVQAAERIADFSGWLKDKGSDAPPPGTVKLTAVVGVADLREQLAKRYNAQLNETEPASE